MTHYAISFYVINPFYWIPPSKHIKMQLATPHVAEQLNRYPQTDRKQNPRDVSSKYFFDACCPESSMQPILSLLYRRAENGVFATSFRHLLQPSMAKLCLWETLLGLRQQQGLWKSSEIFCKGKRMSRMFAYFKNTLHKLWI